MFSAHVPGSNPPAFSRSAFSMSGPRGASSNEHVGTWGALTRGTLGQLVTLWRCDFQSRRRVYRL